MDGVKDASREELLRLLALERERRFTAERTAEEEKQAALQLLLLFQEKAEPLSLQPELTKSHSISSSIISSPIPRAFSQDFYEAVLHELPVDLQDTLAGLQQGNSSGKAPESSSSFAKACFAIEQGNYSQLSLILREDNVNGGGSLEGSEGGKALLVQYGTQLLHLAIEKYTADCVTVLLDKGVSPNESGLSSLPPLHMAAKNGGKKCIKILLHYGAEVNLQDTKGHTPLYLALEAGHGECAQLLLNAKPNLSILTMGRSSLLHAAVSGCKEFELRLILVQIHSSLQPGAISALVNGQESKEGYTPLHLAASKGYLGCIMILLSDPQVNPDLLTFSGETAFGLSSSTDCQLLLSTKKHKEANVVVLAGKGVSSPPRSVIGCVKVLSHHSWSDLEYLVKGALDEFAYVQNCDDDVNDKFMESSAYLKQKNLTVKEEDSVTQLIQVESRKLTDEMKKVITKRQNSLSPPERLSGSIKDIHIGKYNKERSDKQDRKGRSPYEALAELEESGELLEVTVSLQNSYEHISFISLIPSGVLKKYTNQLLNNKCVVIHGPPETDLNQLPGLLLSCLRTATTGEIEKIHLNLSPSFTVAYLVSLLYDNGLLQPCGEGKEQEEPATELPISSLLVMEGIDRLKDFDVLSVLYSLLDDHYAAGEGVWLDTNDQSSISPGKYILSHQCYVIGTRTLFASSGSSLPGDIMDSYAHIWLSDGDEPSLGYLLRYYTRELVSTNKGKLPVKSDYTYQAVVWVWQFWLLYNYYMQQFGYFHLTIGVKLFLNCPVMNADSIYNWFAELWSFHIIPKLKENLLHQETQPQQTKNQKKTDAIYKNLVFFLVHRIVSSTCPLPPEAIHDFLTALYSFNDIMYLSPGQAATDLINKSVGKDLLNGKDTRSPRTKRASKKSSTTDNGKSDEWTVSVADAVRKYQSSIEGLSASTGDLTKIKRPKSGSFFSKNSTLRRSLFRGSKASLYAVEEEDGGGGGGGSSKLKRKKKKEQKDQKEDEESKGEKMEELFDVLMQADERMDDQRVQPPHHVISVVSSSPQATPTTSHSSSHSLTDNLDVIRPLSADRSPSFTPSSDLSLNKLRKTQHPRISNLLEVHSLPHALSRSDENVYHTSTVSSNSSSLALNNSPHPFSASTAPYHPRQISTASSDAAFSDSRRSSTDSMTNSCISGTTSRAQSELIRSGGSEFTRTSSVEGMVNHQRGCSAVTDNDGSSLSAAEGLTSTDTSFIDQNSYSVHVTSTPVTVDSNPNSKQSSVDISNDAPAAADSNPLVASPRTRKLSRSYQALYSASLGFCDTDSLRATQSRKISLPAKIEGPPSPSRRGLKRMMSSSLLDWTLQESVVEM